VVLGLSSFQALFGLGFPAGMHCSILEKVFVFYHILRDSPLALPVVGALSLVICTETILWSALGIPDAQIFHSRAVSRIFSVA